MEPSSVVTPPAVGQLNSAWYELGILASRSLSPHPCSQQRDQIKPPSRGPVSNNQCDLEGQGDERQDNHDTNYETGICFSTGLVISILGFFFDECTHPFWTMLPEWLSGKTRQYHSNQN